MSNKKKQFWRIRLGAAVLQIPIFAWLVVYSSDRVMLVYLGIISVVTWIDTVLSAPEESE